jgi:ABC-type sugar transport system ATPase subunit
VLRIERAGRRFPNGTVALEDVSLAIGSGDFVALLGPSGCGKSTLLRLITGLTEEHDGEIYINGRRVTELDPKDRRVAMVFQSYALYPHLSVARNISFGMEINRVPRAERDRRVLEAARALQLEELLNRRPAELSGGQRQRVAIGRCLVREPDLFLYDEPLSNLDAKLRQETRGELKRLHHRLGATTVYVTHDQYEAMTLATKVVLLDRGRVVQIGTPLELYDRPANRFAARFIGTPAINLLRGRLEPQGDGVRFVGDELAVELPRSSFAARPEAGREVELGIRAESVQPATDGDADFVLVIDDIEPTGSDIFLTGRVGVQEIVARVDRGTQLARGDRLPLRWRAGAASIFDIESGTRL